MNYKAKYLAALNNNGTTPQTVRTTLSNTTHDTTAVAVNTSLELVKLQTTLIESAHAARAVCELMDETRHVGNIDFGETHHIVDGKLGSMSLQIISRRLRDVLRMAEARIGILSAMCEDQHKTIELAAETAATVKGGIVDLQKASLDTLFVGRNATPDELSDLLSTPGANGFNRFDIEYHGIDLESEGLPLTAESVLQVTRHRKQDSAVSGMSAASDSESDTDNDAQSDNDGQRPDDNRLARVVPREKRANGKGKFHVAI